MTNRGEMYQLGRLLRENVDQILAWRSERGWQNQTSPNTAQANPATTQVQENYGSQPRQRAWLGIVVLCAVGLVAVTNPNNLNPPLFLAIMCLPMVIADFREHHNKLAIAMLNGTLVTLVMTVAYSKFGGVLMFALVFMLSSIGWLVALVWSCLKVKKWEN